MYTVVADMMTRPLPVELSWALSGTYIRPSVGPNFPSNSALVFSQRSRSSWRKDDLGFLSEVAALTHTQKSWSAWNQPPRLTVARSGMNPVPYLQASQRTSAVCLSLFFFKKKTRREAELFARDFTGSEIFTQTFLLRQH